VSSTVVVSAALVALGGGLLFCGRKLPVPPRSATLWTTRARRSWGALFAAYALFITAVVAGIAGAASPFVSAAYSVNAIPGFSVTSTAFYTAFVQCASATAGPITFSAGCSAYFEVKALVGAALVFAGLGLFTFPAAVITCVASARVRHVFSAGAMPPVGCCREASLPAATALAWVGVAVECLGGGLMWSFFVPSIKRQR
jgi:hypothetical protein